MTPGTLKKTMASLLAALTFASIAVPAEAQYYGRPYGYGPGYRGYGPGYRHYGPPPPPPGYYYRRHRNNAAGAVAAGAILGLAAGAAIAASQNRRCWTERQKVYLDDGRRVWRNVKVCR